MTENTVLRLKVGQIKDVLRKAIPTERAFDARAMSFYISDILGQFDKLNVENSLNWSKEKLEPEQRLNKLVEEIKCCMPSSSKRDIIDILVRLL